jgi:ATP-dependent RNA helicase DeaD
VGAIANETGIHPDYIGSIQIRARHTIIEMPADIPKDVFDKLGKVWVRNKPLKIQRDSGEIANFNARPRRFRDRNENGGGNRDERSFSERRRANNKSGDKRHANKGPRGKKPGFDADAPLRKAAGADF